MEFSSEALQVFAFWELKPVCTWNRLELCVFVCVWDQICLGAILCKHLCNEATVKLEGASLNVNCMWNRTMFMWLYAVLVFPNFPALVGNSRICNISRGCQIRECCNCFFPTNTLCSRPFYTIGIGLPWLTGWVKEHQTLWILKIYYSCFELTALNTILILKTIDPKVYKQNNSIHWSLDAIYLITVNIKSTHINR